MYGNSGGLFALSKVRQLSNSASSASTSNLGCGTCSLQTNGGAAASVDNAPSGGTTIAGERQCSSSILLHWSAVSAHVPPHVSLAALLTFHCDS